MSHKLTNLCAAATSCLNMSVCCSSSCNFLSIFLFTNTQQEHCEFRTTCFTETRLRGHIADKNTTIASFQTVAVLVNDTRSRETGPWHVDCVAVSVSRSEPSHPESLLVGLSGFACWCGMTLKTRDFPGGNCFPGRSSAQFLFLQK